MENDGRVIEMEGESRGRKVLSDFEADVRRLSDRGCKWGAETASTVGAGREWRFPMVGSCSDCGTGNPLMRVDIYRTGGER